MKNGRAGLSKILEAKPEDKYTLTDGVWNALKRHAARHKKLNHGFGYGLVDINDINAITRTLSARYYKDGAEILIPQKKNNPRLQVSSAEQYAEIMNNLNLANPKMMDIAVPTNKSHGMSMEQQKRLNGLSINEVKELIDQKDTRLFASFASNEMVQKFPNFGP